METLYAFLRLSKFFRGFMFFRGSQTNFGGKKNIVKFAVHAAKNNIYCMKVP